MDDASHGILWGVFYDACQGPEATKRSKQNGDAELRLEAAADEVVAVEPSQDKSHPTHTTGHRV